MIKNKIQMNHSLKRIEELSHEYVAINDDKKISEIEKEYFLGSIKSLTDEIQAEIDEFNKLRKSKFVTLSMASPEELPLLLIKARIAKQISQQELANRLGVHKQQVQRSESVDNQNLSYLKLLEIAEALGVKICFQEIEIIGRPPLFKLPDNIPEETVEAIEHLTNKQHSLLFN